MLYRLLVVTVLLLAGFMCSAFAAGGFGQIKGTLKYDDEYTVGYSTIVAKVDTETFQLQTDENGEFMGVIKSGEVNISVNGITIKTTVTPGEVTEVTIAMKRPGWIISVIYPEEAPAAVSQVECSYKRAIKPGVLSNAQTLSTMQIAPGTFWVRDMPANAASIMAVAMLGEGPSAKLLRKRWDFTTAQAQRRLTMVAEHSPQLWLKLVDETGHPMTGAGISGKIQFQQPDFNYDFWSGKPFPTSKHALPLNDIVTDARGMAYLGRWPERDYTLTLVSGNRTGVPQTLTLHKDGTHTLKQYAADCLPRDVTEVVRDATHNPVPQAVVYASYMWEGIQIIRQTSDADGKVFWKNLPPVRVITWGEGVVPAVIPISGTTFDNPAPLQPSTDSGMFNFLLSGLGPQRLHYDGSFRYQNGEQPSEQTLNVDYDPEAQDAAEWELFNMTLRFGTPISLQLISSTSPPSLVSLHEVYVPYADLFADYETIPWHLTTMQGAEVHGRLLTKQGEAVHGVSRLSIELVKAADGYADMHTNMPVVEYADGTFTATMLVPGTYRASVDLFDASVPESQQLLFEVKPGSNEIVRHLPDPIATVPAGTTVTWLTRTQPMMPHTFCAGAATPQVPIYGPKESLLAFWYRPTPGMLTIWDAAEGAERLRTLSLRTAYLSAPAIVDTKEQPTSSQSCRTILPLLPNDDREMTWYSIPMRPNIIAPEQECMPFQFPETHAKVLVWSGKNLILTDDYRLETINIPTEGPAEITLAPRRNTPDYTRYQLARPSSDMPTGEREDAPRATCIFDVPDCYGNTTAIANAMSQRAYGIAVPHGATKMTVQCLGTGVIPDLILPAPAPTDDDPIFLALPAWTPGCVVTGKLYNADGTPGTQREIAVTLNGDRQRNRFMMSDRSSVWSGQLRLTTDRTGGFSIKGLLPGDIITINIEGQEQSRWELTVPNGGIADLNLKITAHPMTLSGNINYDLQPYNFWIPDKGTPSMFTQVNGQYMSPSALPGTGYLWSVDGTTGRASLQRISLATGENRVQSSPQSASLGLYFPLVVSAGLPGKVTLIGMGDRAGLYVTFPCFGWAPSAALDLVVGQIDAVPPGDYRVIVDTVWGPTTGTVTVTDKGGVVKFTYPPMPIHHDGEKVGSLSSLPARTDALCIARPTALCYNPSATEQVKSA